jgi:hypothetical protein
MGLPNVEFVTDDVRNFSRKRYGAFDVVICSGILYHLPGKDGCRFRFVADSMAGGPLGTYSFQFPGKDSNIPKSNPSIERAGCSLSWGNSNGSAA